MTPHGSSSSAARFAERYFGKEDPIGQYLELPDLAKPPVAMTDTTFRVVGIVADFRNQGPESPAWPSLYMPTTLTVFGNTPRQIVARTTTDSALVAPGIAQAVGALSSDVAIGRSGTLEADLRESLAQPRFFLLVLTTFATIGLLLVAVGVYGVMAYAVSRRAQEFAIRMALGATASDVVRTVVRSGAVLLAVGIVDRAGHKPRHQPPRQQRRHGSGTRWGASGHGGLGRRHRRRRSGCLPHPRMARIEDQPDAGAAAGLGQEGRRREAGGRKAGRQEVSGTISLP